MGTPRRWPPRAFDRALALALADESQAQGLSQGALGSIVGLSQGMVSMLLAAKRPLTVDELHAFCKALGMDLLTVTAEAIDSLPEGY